MAQYRAVSAVGKRAIAAAAANPSTVLLVTDYDGTLASCVDNPTKAFPLPAAIQALGRLGQHLGHIAIVSGREVQSAVKLGDFESVPGLENLIVLGQFGVERWDAASGTYLIPPIPAAVNDVAAELPHVLADAGYPDLRVEHKRRAFGIHTREHPKAEDAYQRLRQPLTELAMRHGMQMEPGRLVLEIRAGACDKGRALSQLVAELKPGLVIYLGDDIGDIPAFELLGELQNQGIVGIGVCSASQEQPEVTEFADIIATGPEGVAAWLTALADTIEHSSLG